MFNRNMDTFTDETRFAAAQLVSREEQSAIPLLTDLINNMLRDKTLEALKQRQEETLIGIFGSESEARKYAHLMVLEDYPMEFRVEEEGPFAPNIRYSVEQKFRFRFKTPEEIFGPFAGSFMATYRNQYSGLDPYRPAATISDLQFVQAVARLRKRWVDGDGWHYVRVQEMDQELDIAPKRIRSKMRRLLKRGLIDGCNCGCRGDIQLTEKGELLLAAGVDHDWEPGDNVSDLLTDIAKEGTTDD